MGTARVPRGLVARINFFVTTPYEPDAEGRLRAVMPACCSAGAGRSCTLVVVHYRARATGPECPLAVVRCREHSGSAFTLYPPGYTPYGRRPVAPVSLSGQVLRDGESSEPVWRRSVFSASLDASDEFRWPRTGVDVRRTQGRQLDAAQRLLGLGLLDDDALSRQATLLGVPTLGLRTARARTRTESWTARGAAVVSILDELEVDGRLLDRLLLAGAGAGLWGRPLRWDRARQTMVRGRSEPPERPPDQGSGR